MNGALRNAWIAELVKISTVRGLRVGAVLAALALPLTSLLVVSTGGLGTNDTVTSGAATGAVVLLLGYGAWAASLSGSEYVYRTIAVSLAGVPRRSLLYVAKIGAAATVAGAGAASAALTSLLVVGAVTPDGHGLGSPATLLGLVLAAAAVAAVGTAVGILTRSTTTAMAVITAAVLAPKAAAGLLGSLEPWVVGASPGTVVTQFVQGAQLASDQSFPGGTAAAALSMLLVAGAVAAGGAVAFARRDG